MASTTVANDVEQNSNGGAAVAATKNTSPPTITPEQVENETTATTATMTMMLPQQATPQGLAAFLAEIDGPCPFLKNTNDTSSMLVAATYQATAVKIPASDKKQVRIPILSKNSTVTWHVGVDECDVMFSIFQETTTGGEGEEDVVVALVEPQTVTAASKGDQEATLDTSTSSNASATSATATSPNPALSGEFVVSETPSTIILQFGNEYSWFTPKTISYSVTVTPPPDPVKMERAKRAAAALQVVLQQTSLAQAEMDKRTSVVQEQTSKVQEVSRTVTEKSDTVKYHETVVQAAHDQMREIGQLHQKVTESLATKRAQLSERNSQIVDLERQIAALQRQRLARIQEREALERDVAAGESSAQKLLQRGQLMMQETKQDEVYLMQIQDERQAAQNQVVAANKRRDEALQEQQTAAQALDFLKRLADALRLRL